MVLQTESVGGGARDDAYRALQSRALELAIENRPLGETLDALLRALEAGSGQGVLSSILLLDPTGTHLRHGAAPSLPAAYNAAIDGIAIGEGVGSCGTAAARDAPVFVADIERDPLWADFRELALSHGLRACWSMPIRDGQAHVLGTFAMYYPQPQQPTAADVEIVDLVARSAALVIQRERAQSDLATSEERLRLATEAAEIGFWDVDVVTDTLTWPASVKAMFGISPHVPVTMLDFYQGLHPEDREHTTLAYEAAADPARRALYDVEYRTVGQEDAVVRWVAAKGRGLFDETGRCVRVIGAAIDVTARKRIEEQLKRANQELERQVARRTAERNRLWGMSSTLMAVLALDGQLREVNPAWTSLLGWPEAAVVGRPFQALIHPDEVAAASEQLARLERAERLEELETLYRCRDGSYRSIAWRLERGDGLLHGVGRDITAEKAQAVALAQAEEALRQSQKMDAVGQLTGGIAHDFNNMLAVVIGSLDLLSRRVGADDARARRYVDAATEGARRAASLTQRLLAFSRQQPLRPEPVDVNRLVAGMGDLLRHSLGGDVRAETVLAGGLWRTHADPNQLENAILNLAINARDAMSAGGRITIETQNAHLDERYIAAHIGVPSGQYVLIAVSDTGSGMSEAVIAKAFDPFFTTKAVGKGTGLGLSQVYGFVKQSGGHVKIYSELGQGTTVKIYLPRLLGAEADPGAEMGAGDLALGDSAELVLVVEDEPAVRQFSVDALAELGYRVLEASGAAAALALLDAHPEIDLLFTDVVMPDINGAQLADEARRRRPDLKILFTTGYTRNAIVHNGVLDPGVQMIGKPYTIEELAAKLRATLDPPAG